MIAAYVQALLKAKAGDEAEATLSKALKQEWNDDLVALYGRLPMDGLIDDELPPKVGSRRVPTTPRCCWRWDVSQLASRDWVSAREYFEASLKQRRSAEAYAELGRLCLAMGERPRAAELLAQSIEHERRAAGVAVAASRGRT